jgi:pimeloyl-ACP methyl ester carboxylesterase
VLLPGPWEHRFVSANGARFHVAEAGSGPLVLMLHGFPEFWWAWRDQFEPLTSAGFRVAALDLRGYGASDKPPGGYDLENAAADVSGVIRSLGEEHAVVVGHGLGGAVAWALAALHSDRVWALGAIAAPHPRLLLRLPVVGTRSISALARHLRVGENELAREPWRVHQILSSAAGRQGWPPVDVAARSQEAMTIPFAAHGATSWNQAILRTRLSPGSRHIRRQLARPIDQPLLLVWGGDDPLCPSSLMSGSLRQAPRRAASVVIDGAGHYPHEETPAAVSDHLVAWLESLT